MPINVLIVDDSATMRQMIQKTLAMSGLDIADVFEAANGIEAFAQLAQHDVGVILLDINMPVMNGLQFLSRLQDDERLRGIPVVIASTEGSEPRIQQLMANGARAYVRKPFHAEHLRDALLPILGASGDASFVADDSCSF